MMARSIGTTNDGHDGTSNARPLFIDMELQGISDMDVRKMLAKRGWSNTKVNAKVQRNLR
jgi:hypothetical protein